MMKKKFVFTLLLALFSLVGCDQSNTQETILNDLSITFLNQDGSTYSVIDSEMNQIFNDFSVPEKIGYSLDGIFNDPELSDEISFPITITADASFYLSFIPNEYTISFDQTDLQSNYSDILVTYGDTLPILDIPTKEDYTFAGFYTMQNGEGVQIYNSEMIPLTTWGIPNNQILYPSWIEIEYITNNDLTYENQNIGTHELIYGKSFNIPCPEGVLNEGEQFAYWYIIVDENEIVISDANGDSLENWTYKVPQVIYAMVYNTISSIEDLLSINLDGNYVLTNDIVTTETFDTYLDEGIVTGFTGTIDGQGYKITFDITKCGLFAKNYGTIKNLSIQSQRYFFDASYSDGAFAGKNYGLISDVNYKVLIYGVSWGVFGGGICGSNYGIIRSANTYISFASSYDDQIAFGGISYENQGLIENSYSRINCKTDQLRASISLGGIIVNQTETGIIRNTYSSLSFDVRTIYGYNASGSIKIGGFIVTNRGSIYDSYSTGYVKFDSRQVPTTMYRMDFSRIEVKAILGGFSAENYSSDETRIERCYSTVDFTDINVYCETTVYNQNTNAIAIVKIGAFTTFGYSNIYDSFSTGDVSAKVQSVVEYSNGDFQGSSQLIIGSFSTSVTEESNNCYVIDSQSLIVQTGSDDGTVIDWSETSIENLQSRDWILSNLFLNNEGLWIFGSNEFPIYSWGDNHPFE